MPFRLQLYHPIQLRLKMPSTTLKMLLNTNVIGHFQIYHVRLVLYSTLVPSTSVIEMNGKWSIDETEKGTHLRQQDSKIILPLSRILIIIIFIN